MPTAIITVDAEGLLTWCNAPAEKAVSDRGAGFCPFFRDRRGPSRVRACRWRISAAGSPASCGMRWRASRRANRAFLDAQSVERRACPGDADPPVDGGWPLPGRGGVDRRHHGPTPGRRPAGATGAYPKFWRELAAGISHEIRNPLVAIKTFTQLLPQRYTDENFRLEFREMVTREVGRLDGIVAQIEGFAHPTVGLIDTADLSMPCCRRRRTAPAPPRRRSTRKSRSPPTRRPATLARGREGADARDSITCSSTGSRRR